MAKIKVHEIAKEFDIKSSEVIAVLASMGIEGKAPASGLEDDQAEAVRKKLSKGAPAKAEKKPEEEAPKPVKKEAAKPAAKPVRPAGDAAAPIRKKKPIIVVSSARNAQAQGRGGAQPGRGTGGMRPKTPGGIIRPTVPTTAERAARLAENNQGGDRDRLRRTGVAPKKESTETVKTDVNTAGSGSDSAGSASGTAGPQTAPVERRTAVSSAATGARPARGDRRPTGDRPAGDRPARGGIVINQGRGFNASQESGNKDGRRGGSDRKGNTSKDKNKKDRIYENEDGFKGGKQVKGKSSKMMDPKAKAAIPMAPDNNDNPKIFRSDFQSFFLAPD